MSEEVRVVLVRGTGGIGKGGIIGTRTRNEYVVYKKAVETT